MKILITGAGGFIGNNLARRLALNYELFLVDMVSPFEISNTKWGIVDLSSDFSFEVFPTDIDVIIHLAQGKKHRDFPDSALDNFQINTMCALKLLEFGRDIGLSKFFYASTASIYSGYKEEYQEDDKISTIKDFYALSKYQGEMLVKSYSDFMTTVIFRFITVYGPGQKRRLIPKLIENVIQNEDIQIYGTEGIRLNPIYIDDCVEVIVRALDLENTTVLNVGGNESLSILQMSRIIGDILGIDPRFEFLRDQREGNYVGAIERMADLLKYRPKVSFREGIKKTLERMS